MYLSRKWFVFTYHESHIMSGWGDWRRAQVLQWQLCNPWCCNYIETGNEMIRLHRLRLLFQHWADGVEFSCEQLVLASEQSRVSLWLRHHESWPSWSACIWQSFGYESTLDEINPQLRGWRTTQVCYKITIPRVSWEKLSQRWNLWANLKVGSNGNIFFVLP